jgi:hypothetical protein
MAWGFCLLANKKVNKMQKPAFLPPQAQEALEGWEAERTGWLGARGWRNPQEHSGTIVIVS